MEKLATKFDFNVFRNAEGHIQIDVTRLFDGAKKTYTQVYGDVERVTEFMNSITDDLAEGYFPKPRKAKK